MLPTVRVVKLIKGGVDSLRHRTGVLIPVPCATDISSGINGFCCQALITQPLQLVETAKACTDHESIEFLNSHTEIRAVIKLPLWLCLRRLACILSRYSESSIDKEAINEQFKASKTIGLGHAFPNAYILCGEPYLTYSYPRALGHETYTCVHVWTLVEAEAYSRGFDDVSDEQRGSCLCCEGKHINVGKTLY